MALQAVEMGCSQRKAAAVFNIPQTTLSDICRGLHKCATGGQTALSDEEEIENARAIATLGDWGFPLDILEVRIFISGFLREMNKRVEKFRENIPGVDWVYAFLKRQSDIISPRMCRNITHKRASVTQTDIDDYFMNLEVTLSGVPPENIINYDETNLSDDPGAKKCVFRRSTKYPERIMNATKASTSIMFACSGSGKLLPPYVVYKSEHLHDRWIEGGPLQVRYNRSRSGWFDTVCFTDWFETVALPYCRRLPGKKVLIGDNLSSHFSIKVIEKCTEAGIAFVCLPPNSTHICQPLDVSTFAPTKRYWRKILTDWKLHEGGRLVAVPKEWFPRLLTRLLDAMKPSLKSNLISGFRKCGIVPLDKSAVSYKISRTPAEALAESCRISSAITPLVLEKLEEIKRSLKGPATKTRKKRLNVVPGKSISLTDFQLPLVSSGSEDESTSVSDDDESHDDSEIPMPPPHPRPNKAVPKSNTSSKVRLPLKPKMSWTWDEPSAFEAAKTTGSVKNSRFGRNISKPPRFSM
jgi:hypothetical protein